jgi:hypothetical protein
MARSLEAMRPPFDRQAGRARCWLPRSGSAGIDGSKAQTKVILRVFGLRGRSVARRTRKTDTSPVAGLDQLPKQPLPGGTSSVSANTCRLPSALIIIHCLLDAPCHRAVVVGGPQVPVDRAVACVLQPVDQHIQAGRERSLRWSSQTCSPGATRAEKRSWGRERKNWCSGVLIAGRGHAAWRWYLHGGLPPFWRRTIGSQWWL